MNDVTAILMNFYAAMRKGNFQDGRVTFVDGHPITETKAQIAQAVLEIIGERDPKVEGAGKSAIHRRWARNALRTEQLKRLEDWIGGEG